MTLQGSRAVRRSGVVASADLLPLDAIVIPEKRAPQLCAPKKSPSVQLGAVVMSRRERCSSCAAQQTTIKTNCLLLRRLRLAFDMLILSVFEMHAQLLSTSLREAHSISVRNSQDRVIQPRLHIGEYVCDT